MDRLDVMVLRTMRQWMGQGSGVVLATVIRTWGSSPRPVGAMMAFNSEGHVVGSVSGGCIEDDLVHRYALSGARRPLPAKPVEFVEYGVSADEAHRFGLPCGGTLELVLEFAPERAGIDALLDLLEAGVLVQRTLHVETGHVELATRQVSPGLHADARRVVATLGPAHRMLLIGAGDLAFYVATIARFNGFEVTICDPRPERRAMLEGSGVASTTEMPDDAVTAFRPDPGSCVVALSHDPKLDDMALLEAVHSDAFYVGAIGSRRNNRARRERFIAHFGESEASLQGLRGPIGIYIGSKTPAEIAVSLMAEVIAVKNGVSVPRLASVGMAKDAGDAARVSPVCG
ncbi:xanthine dehydrogenase accessory protein XdhC [Bordetella ansorpii]|jgi:xanthine dehydrogenase accessory factor|uniref:Xanthine dehydrogenase accessory protein XdhC n=1 Tax=Bordetella ansorpii TaxID=288768 RepID=A0A157Q7K0_9BORD|nr:XdhC family protein [Bordetella ansorpii]SAI41842.1 xanthine dehydrogenase accessory protein XdhC [Bordetella ansorpii]